MHTDTFPLPRSWTAKLLIAPLVDDRRKVHYGLQELALNFDLCRQRTSVTGRVVRQVTRSKGAPLNSYAGTAFLLKVGGWESALYRRCTCGAGEGDLVGPPGLEPGTKAL